MDPYGRIYRAPDDEIPAEDKARLDGYLRARSEQDDLAALKERYEALEAKLAAEGSD